MDIETKGNSVNFARADLAASNIGMTGHVKQASLEKQLPLTHKECNNKGGTQPQQAIRTTFQILRSAHAKCITSIHIEAKAKKKSGNRPGRSWPGKWRTTLGTKVPLWNPTTDCRLAAKHAAGGRVDMISCCSCKPRLFRSSWQPHRLQRTRTGKIHARAQHRTHDSP